MIKYYTAMVLSVIVASFSQILLKKSTQKKHENVIKEYLNFYVLLGYVLLLFSTLLTVYALKGLEYKNAPIIESLGYVLILVLSYLIFHEKITNRIILGNAIILIGIIVFYV